MNWIDDKIILDFPLPKDIQGIADECERLNAEHDWGYINWAEVLSDLCKEAVIQRHMTRAQWDLVERRYVYGSWDTDR